MQQQDWKAAYEGAKRAQKSIDIRLHKFLDLYDAPKAGDPVERIVALGEGFVQMRAVANTMVDVRMWTSLLTLLGQNTIEWLVELVQDQAGCDNSGCDGCAEGPKSEKCREHEAHLQLIADALRNLSRIPAKAPGSEDTPVVDWKKGTPEDLLRAYSWHLQRGTGGQVLYGDEMLRRMQLLPTDEGGDARATQYPVDHLEGAAALDADEDRKLLQYMIDNYVGGDLFSDPPVIEVAVPLDIVFNDEDDLRTILRAAIKVAAESKQDACPEDCTYCSGEVCVKHPQEECECDIIERHPVDCPDCSRKDAHRHCSECGSTEHRAANCDMEG